MKKISELIPCDLKWIQPSTFRMLYELRANAELAGTLGFRSAFGTFATGESGDGCWTFKRVGFFQTRATIRVCGEADDLAIFRNNTWSGGGTLEVRGGEKFLAILIGLIVLAGREWIVEAARQPQLLQDLAEQTLGLLSLARRADLLAGLAIRVVAIGTAPYGTSERSTTDPRASLLFGDITSVAKTSYAFAAAFAFQPRRRPFPRFALDAIHKSCYKHNLGRPAGLRMEAAISPRR